MRNRVQIRRLLAALLVPAVLLLGCPPPNPPLAPIAGAPEYQRELLHVVPGGLVHTGGGNLLLERSALSLDTRLGRRDLTARYNSATATWRWGFERSYDGAVFVDADGAQHDTSALPDGAAIPGSTWVRLDAATLRTKGGLIHAFDAAGRLEEVRFASAPYPALRYAAGPVAGATRTVAVEQCTAAAACEAVFDFTYDEQGRLTAIDDRAGRRAAFGYDGSGRLVQARDGLDFASGAPGFRYEYDAAGRVTAQVNSEGERIEYTYAGGRLVQARGIGGGDPRHTLAYEGKDTSGLYVTRVVDPVGAETRYRYDADRRLHEWIQVDVDAHRTLAWSGLRPIRETLPDGRTTSFSWSDDDVVSRTDPSGNVATFTYAPAAVDRAHPERRPLLAVTDLLGPVETRGYDGAGRLLFRENGAGERTTWTYGPDGTVASATLPDGFRLDFADYGSHGHPESVTGGGQLRTWTFDAVGNALRGGAAPHPPPGSDGGIDPETAGVLERRYDEDRNVIEIDVVGVSQGLPTVPETIRIERRSDGRERAVRRPGGGDHEFDYDALGRLVTRREREGGVWHATTFEYDLAGRRTAENLPNGMRRAWSFDPAGCPTTRTLSRAGTVEAVTELGYVGHRLTSVTDPLRGTVEHYTHDGAGRVVLTLHPDGEQTYDTFDLRSRRASRAFLTPGLALVAQLAWSYDEADRPLTLSEGGVPVVARTYTEGRISEITTGNGLVRTFERESTTGLLTASATHDATGALVAETTITRTPLGQLLAGVEITATTTTHRGVIGTTRESYWVGPEDPGQVIPNAEAGEAVFAWEADGLPSYVFYDHDVLGLRTGAGFASNAEGNRLLQANGRSYAWDEAGFAVERGGEALTWHASGRLATHGNDTFEWDALDRPLAFSLAGTERRWGYGGAIEVDAGGSALALDLGEVRLDLAASARSYRHRDFRGNVKFTTDEGGDVRTHYRYDPYGVDQVIGADDDPIRFAEGAELGGALALLGQRVYDADAARFLSPDPVFQVFNQWGYTFANPVWFWDPGGTHQRPSPESQASMSNGLGAFGHFIGSLVAVASILVAGPAAPAFYVGALAALFAFEGLATAWYTAQLLNSSFTSSGANTPQRSGVMTPGGGNRSGGGGAGLMGGPTCAPLQIGRVPLPGGAVVALVLLQGLLMLLWIRRRART